MAVAPQVTEQAVADAVQALAQRGPFTATDLTPLARDLRVDRDHLVAAAWDLVEDGALTYGADAVFRPVSLRPPAAHLSGMTSRTEQPAPHPNSAPLLRTADGVEITDGLMVWDYDLERGSILLPRGGYNGIDSPTWDGWFDVVRADGTRKLMNGERVITVHPSTREPAGRQG